MSRVGKKTIELPSQVEVQTEQGTVIVKGPKGELREQLPPEFAVEKEGQELKVVPQKEETGQRRKKQQALWGLYRSLLANMVKGVSEGYEKRLEIEGTGYRAGIEGTKLNLNLGFSHPVQLEIPEGITCSVEKGTISIAGIDKKQVGEFAAAIRRIRPVEPYKGKGIRYEGEEVRRKEGKKAAGTTAA